MPLELRHVKRLSQELSIIMRLAALALGSATWFELLTHHARVRVALNRISMETARLHAHLRAAAGTDMTAEPTLSIAVGIRSCGRHVVVAEVLLRMLDQKVSRSLRESGCEADSW